MKKIFLAGLISMGLFANAQDETISSKIDSLLTDAGNKQILSGIVIVSHAGKEIYSKQIGYADWQTKRSLTRSTLFNIGSLNKQFTEELIHQLVKENKLKYEDKLSAYLNLYPQGDGSKITVQQLLDMSAGLGDYLRDPKFREIENSDFKLSQLIDIIKTEPLLYEPGKGKEYSNSGYAVLGALIEKVTGKSYEENLKERVIKPLGLQNIFYSKAEKENQKNRAFGTSIDFNGNKHSVDDCSNSSPAGGAYVNATDMLKFAEAKMKSKLPSGKIYGHGMFAGGTPLWNSVISYNDKNEFCFIVLANTKDIAEEIAVRIKSIIKNEAYPPLELPFIMTLYKTINKEGYTYIKSNAEKLAQLAQRSFDDRFFNFYGYQFMNADQPEIAIKLFKINTELFPAVANAFDSLGEAYEKTGDKKNAIASYKKALELDPKNIRLQNNITKLAN
jgi:CubicO group peptidase (beta-lactamase class C family)